VRKAAQIASRCGAKLTLFHAYSMPYPLPSRIPADGRALLEVAAAERREELLQLARPLKAAGLKVAVEVVWDFPAFEAIVRHAAKQRPDLLVAESRRHSRVGRWFLANTDWELIREVPCPVWFVKQPTLPKQPRFLMALDPTHARAKPARLDDRIAALTAGAVEHLNGKVALVHAGDVMQVLPKGFMADVMIPGAAIKAAENQRRAAKRSLAATLRRYSLEPFAEVVRAGLPDETIVTAAKQTRADVVVLGAVSRSGLKRSFVGSTAEKVIDAVASDLLIVKPAGFRTNVPRRVPRLGRTIG
jgi:universal stress protein E